MDGQVTAGTLVCAIPKKVVVAWLTNAQVALCRTLADTADIFLKPGMSPADVHGFECRVEGLVRELARAFEQLCFNSLEPQKVEAMPQHVEHLGQRLAPKRKRASQGDFGGRQGTVVFFCRISNPSGFREGEAPAEPLDRENSRLSRSFALPELDALTIYRNPRLHPLFQRRL